MEIRKILIVDDEEHIRMVSRLSAERVGKWEVRLAESGRQALEAVREERPDLILMDVMMPELDGPGTLRELQSQPETADVPVIFLTAKAQTHEVEGYLELGAVGVIQKPFDPMELPEQIRAIAQEL